ncbi:Conserved hypothetical protein [Shewanella piezotolerans WP3]|uniref:Uncharacterized protein n=1 Tax=Shewanella piezotolerans (strain WP3 / JCM 13877) TaxID=225849 RepID=B8CL27_SHEPW|nr:polysialyltransferase family glycosyltransferase [Shewanella piezotolerans]ACJ28353.1 Conserved hypothetical protein [Shewanella piezotolerans WP3]
MKIAVYDVNLVNHMNYIGGLIKEFRSRSIEVIAFYDEYNSDAYSFLTEIGVTCIKVRHISFKEIASLLTKNQVTLLVHNAQRLGDTAFVSVARSLGLKSIMIQHGMYVSHLKRERSLFILKIIKTLRYVKYSRVVAKAIGLPFIGVFNAFIKHFVKSIDYTKAITFYNKINSDHVLVYGEFWKEYHSSNFGYSKDCMSIIGYHELLKVEPIKSKELEQNKICYVAQTLVEDGRMGREQMADFLRQLSSFSAQANIPVVVKLHPRSDISLYESHNFSLSEEQLPHVPIYLGHYSSLLALCGSISNLYLYEFPEHDIPDYFKENSSVFSDFVKLSNGITDYFKEPIDSECNFNSVFAKGISDSLVADRICELSVPRS